MRRFHTVRSDHTVTFTLDKRGDKQKLFIFVEAEGTGVVQSFELNQSLNLAVLESLIASAKEAS
ncbi:MAG: hypothetical protein Q8N44_20105 [Rubrivivax sp.]|nr:hypothetical protein [Rubrivivax sp.]